MNYGIFEQELYYRGVSYFERTLRCIKTKKGGRPLPGAPRQFEEIKIPNLMNSNQWLNYYIGLTIYAYENDLAVSRVLNHILRIAKRYQYEGSWKIWLDYIDYFQIEEEETPLDKDKRNVIDTCFDIPSIFDFLSEHFSDDEIFGNILNSAARLICNCYKLVPIDRTNHSKVRWPQRKRGYTDKGSLAPFGFSAVRDANYGGEDSRDRRSFDSISHVQLFGNPNPRE